MTERFNSIETILKEALEQKIKRLRPVFLKSFEVFADESRNLKEGALIVTRIRSDKQRLQKTFLIGNPTGEQEIIANLVVVGINGNGPELAGIDDEGNPTASATMLWEEIVDAK